MSKAMDYVKLLYCTVQKYLATCEEITWCFRDSV